MISYAYLWREEARRGTEEGRKDRPCVVVLAIERGEAGVLVTVAPITHSRPGPSDMTVELPIETKHRLGLDGERSWVIVHEMNRFTWQGYDLRPTRRGAVTCAFGLLPKALFRRVRDAAVEAVTSGKMRFVDRSN